jgi:hypothetical protein
MWNRSARSRLPRAAALVFALVLLAIARQVRADQVSGTVTIGGQPAANNTLVLRAVNSQGAVEVRTTPTGTYSVFLEPGRYEASLKDRPQEVLPLDSLRAPVKRDLAFARR